MQIATLPVTAPSQTQQTRRYTQTSVMQMWKDTTVTTNADGEEEAYSIAPDGFIWSYTVDSKRGRTGRLFTTKLRASAFALGKSPNGHTVVIAADDAFVQFVLETGDPKRRWSTPRSVSFLDVQQKVVANEKLLTRELAGNLFVGLRSWHCSTKGEASYQFWEDISAGIGVAFNPSPMETERQSSTWLQKLSDTFS